MHNIYKKNKRKVRAIIESDGYKFPQICTPEELMEKM